MKKKLAVLLLAAGMLLGASGSASAIDFKVKGWWWMAFDYAHGGDFMGKTRAGANKTGSRHQGPHIPMDDFEAWNRLMFKLDAVVNENLSGTVMFEIGDQFWGQEATGGALGADGTVVEVKNAYIDWTVPNTDLKLRMGLQLVALPSFTFENNVFIDDVAGITASYACNENISLTGMWMRPYNDNYTQNAPLNHNESNNYLDNMDLFALSLPMRFDGIRITPWAMMAGIGPNVMALTSANDPLTGVPRLGTNPAVINSQAGQTWGQLTSGMLPAAISTNDQRLRNDSYSTGVWAGLTGELTMLDPWRFAWDVNYGSVTGDKGYLNRSGWMVNALLEYKMDWATPGIYGWYSTGDDSNPHNGSERMPFISQVNIGGDSLSNFGFRSSPWVNNEGILGGNAVGLWGVGARLKDISFMDNLKSTLLVNFFGGTNDTKMASYILGRHNTDSSGRQVYRRWTDFNSNYGVYLTEADTGIEVNLNSQYKVYDNLTVLLELGYIHLWLDESKSVWGRSGGSPHNNLNYQDAWKASLGFQYSF